MQLLHKKVKRYILIKKIRLFITEATCANSLLHCTHCYWSQRLRAYHRLIQNSSLSEKRIIQNSSLISFPHKMVLNGARSESITKHSNVTSYHKYAKYVTRLRQRSSARTSSAFSGVNRL